MRYARGVSEPLLAGRYALHAVLASGGMGTVHLGRVLGEAGFARPVAIKRMHPHLLEQAELRQMFVEEARLASRVRHPNVVPTLDVVAGGDELFVVMDYVHGAPLSLLLAQARADGRPVPLRIASAIASGILAGLHAAHEARDERGAPLGIVHRDVSPQNVVIGTDGTPRVLDFGVAKATARLSPATDTGALKGKLGYAAPEQLRGDDVTRAADVYAAGVVLWEMLTARRLFTGDHGQIIEQILVGWVDPPSRWDPSVPAELDAIVLRALESDPAKRFATARELALAIERCVPAAPTLAVVEWLDQVAHDEIHARDALLEGLERELPAPPSSASRREDPSSIEVVAQPRPQPRRRQTVLVAAVGIAALAALGVGTLALRGEPTRSAATAPRVPALPTPPPSASAADVAPVASEPRVAQPVPDVVPDDSPAPRASPPKAGKPPAKAGAAKPADDCTPPYTYDAIGRRIYKRNCLDAR